ncbi:PIG-L deacetylase family protein [Bacillus pseudomycoides]|uniref:PIG-L deacetylase family protein n=1 Tax=Bacillus pseudomycoides TaxID=64104 RepID=UPI000BF97A03|nr:PIG-L family deacetylase [Bacillus pseudomycoides]PGD73697.1 hypothetical protein COM46_21705 [Bacillus pseudomycoides]
MILKNYKKPLLIMAHPDDEIIGASKFLNAFNADLSILFTTNGRCSFYIDETYYKPFSCYSYNFDYIEMREREAKKALNIFGISNVKFSSFDDGLIYQYWKYLLWDIISFISYNNPDLIITNAYEGGNFDHDITNLLVHGACQFLNKNIHILDSYLYNLENGQINHNHIPSGDNSAFLRHKYCYLQYALNDSELQDKHKAMDEYVSQLDTDLKYFRKDKIESFMLNYEPKGTDFFNLPPHEGKLMYELSSDSVIHTFDEFRNIVIAFEEYMKEVNINGNRDVKNKFSR